MADVLVRNLDRETLDRLKARAARNHRSLQSEAKILLEQAAGTEDVVALLTKWQEHFRGQKPVSSVEMIHEDRRR